MLFCSSLQGGTRTVHEKWYRNLVLAFGNSNLRELSFLSHLLRCRRSSCLKSAFKFCRRPSKGSASFGNCLLLIRAGGCDLIPRRAEPEPSLSVAQPARRRRRRRRRREGRPDFGTSSNCRAIPINSLRVSRRS